MGHLEIEKMETELQDLLDRRELARRRQSACARSAAAAREKMRTRKFQAKGDLDLTESARLRDNLAHEVASLFEAEMDLAVFDRLIFKAKRSIHEARRTAEKEAV